MSPSAPLATDVPQIIGLTAGTYEARIASVGAALLELTHDGRPLIYCRTGPTPTPRFRGAVLAPWPNRLADGRYTFGGDVHQLPINEVQRMTALHGLVVYNEWSIGNRDAAGVTLHTVISPQPGYPFSLGVRVHYRLDAAAGLNIALSATNIGDREAPYGASIHPYLRAGSGTVDEWTFGVDAAQVVAVDPDRLLPVATVPVPATPFDFRKPTVIGARQVDHALTGITFQATGDARATLLGPHGHGVEMSWDRTCQWLQVHTTDLPGEPDHRRALAVEPMTCAPDAFNSGDGLVLLQPGAVHEVSWHIRAVSTAAPTP